MNFLAHLFLSGDNHKVMIGNFIGDFVKGRNALSLYEPDIVRGIELHRSIDAFTDTHPLVGQSKKRLQHTYHHYAGVIVDIYYDHFLAKNWDRYHHERLSEFAAKVYAIIQQHAAILPADVNYMLPYMIRGNWLVNYATLEGIQRSLTGMSRRTTFNSRMEEAVNDLQEHGILFENEFTAFFPSLIEHVEKFLNNTSV